jgi:hypothetical protein
MIEEGDIMKSIKQTGVMKTLRNRSGMEMVQVAILIALAVALGMIFKTEITQFVNDTFADLNG